MASGCVPRATALPCNVTEYRYQHATPVDGPSVKGEVGSSSWAGAMAARVSRHYGYSALNIHEYRGSIFSQHYISTAALARAANRSLDWPIIQGIIEAIHHVRSTSSSLEYALQRQL